MEVGGGEIYSPTDLADPAPLAHLPIEKTCTNAK